jgi:hypothetical protein
MELIMIHGIAPVVAWTTLDISKKGSGFPNNGQNLLGDRIEHTVPLPNHKPTNMTRANEPSFPGTQQSHRKAISQRLMN